MGYVGDEEAVIVGFLGGEADGGAAGGGGTDNVSLFDMPRLEELVELESILESGIIHTHVDLVIVCVDQSSLTRRPLWLI